MTSQVGKPNIPSQQLKTPDLSQKDQNLVKISTTAKEPIDLVVLAHFFNSFSPEHPVVHLMPSIREETEKYYAKILQSFQNAMFNDPYVEELKEQYKENSLSVPHFHALSERYLEVIAENRGRYASSPFDGDCF